MVTRTVRELSDDDTAKIAGTYHAWRSHMPGSGEGETTAYDDVPGFCASVKLDVIADISYVLTRGRYVGAEEVEDDGEPLDEKITRLAAEMREGFEKRAELQERVLAALVALEANNG